MGLTVATVKTLINNAINAKLNKTHRDIKQVNSRVTNVDKKVDTDLLTKVTNIENKLKKVTDLIVTDGDGTKFLSDDGTYKTLVIEDGSDVSENIALIVTQNQDAIKTLNGTGVGSVEYKIRKAFTVEEIIK